VEAAGNGVVAAHVLCHRVFHVARGTARACGAGLLEVGAQFLEVANGRDPLQADGSQGGLVLLCAAAAAAACAAAGTVSGAHLGRHAAARSGRRASWPARALGAVWEPRVGRSVRDVGGGRLGAASWVQQAVSA
jgi:hypothetical protein